MASGWQYGPQLADPLDLSQYLLVDSTRPGTGFQEFLGLNFTDSTELTINSGVVTRTQTFHSIDNEGDAASDDLVTINGGSWGDILFLHPEVGSRNFTLKHGTGNILCVGNADITTNAAHDIVMLIHGGTNWAAMHATGQTSSGGNVKTLQYSIDSAPTGSEQDTGLNLPQKGLVISCVLDVTTAESTGGDTRMNVGLLESETNGDADGFLAAVEVNTTGVKGAGGGEQGVFLVFPGHALTGSNAVSLSYTAFSNDWVEMRGTITVVYLDLTNYA